LDIANLKLLFRLGLAFLLSYVPNLVGLATFVGAFAAGLVLEGVFLAGVKQEHALRDLIVSVESLILVSRNSRR
jgi:Kef-type K+ transport system membrane component KefB